MGRKMRLRARGSKVCFTINVKSINPKIKKTNILFKTGLRQVVFGIETRLPQIRRNEKAFAIGTRFTKC